MTCVAVLFWSIYYRVRECGAGTRICGIAPEGCVGAVLVAGETVCSVDQACVGAVVTYTCIGTVGEHADAVVMAA
jgi:hypothetical protein